MSDVELETAQKGAPEVKRSCKLGVGAYAFKMDMY